MSTIYTYNEATGTVEVDSPKGKREITTSKATAIAFGYMGIGLLITAIVAFILGFVFDRVINGNLDNEAILEQTLMTYVAIIIVSGVGLLIDGFVINFMAIRGKKSIWVPYVIYCILMGALFSCFMLGGIDPWTIGEAFLLTAAVFLIMFAIGYFSKVNLNPIAYVGLALVLMLMAFALFVFIAFAITGFSSEALATTYIITELAMYGLICLLMILMVAVDAYNIRKILTRASDNPNVILYCAYVMYVDFIVILMRVIYILAVAKNSSK